MLWLQFLKNDCNSIKANDILKKPEKSLPILKYKSAITLKKSRNEKTFLKN